MSEAPERVYLQHGGEVEDGWPEHVVDVAWCEVRGRDSDVEYVRADLFAALEAEVAAWVLKAQEQHADLERVMSHNVALRAEVERLRTDAARYRWLRDYRAEWSVDSESENFEYEMRVPTGVTTIAHQFHGTPLPSLDEAIDAILGEEGTT